MNIFEKMNFHPQKVLTRNYWGCKILNNERRLTIGPQNRPTEDRESKVGKSNDQPDQGRSRARRGGPRERQEAGTQLCHLARPEGFRNASEIGQEMKNGADRRIATSSINA